MSTEGDEKSAKAFPEGINTVYSQLLDGHGDTDGAMAGFIAYGLYKQAKREWVQSFWERNGRKPNGPEMNGYTSTWTPSQLDGLRQRAQQGLAEYAASVIFDASNQIEQDAIDRTVSTSIDRFDTALERFEENLGGTLKQIADNSKLTRQKAVEGIVLSILGALIYTFLLIVITLCLRFAGIDILGIQEKVNDAVAAAPRTTP